MELEEIKILLNRQTITKPSYQLPDISAILRRKSAGNINRLLRSIRIEMIASFLFLLIALVVPLLYRNTFLQLVAAGTMVYTLFFLSYLNKLYRQLQQYGSEVLSTRLSIQKISHLMTRFTRLYFQLCMLCIPVLFTISGAFFLQDHPGYRVNPANLLHSGAFLIFVAWFLCWSVFMYFFARWYIHKIYGRYLTELNQLLQELKHD